MATGQQARANSKEAGAPITQAGEPVGRGAAQRRGSSHQSHSEGGDHAMAKKTAKKGAAKKGGKKR